MSPGMPDCGAARAGFDDIGFYELIAGGTGSNVRTGEKALRLERLPRTTSEQPFDAWRADTEHDAY